jgi:hypothetical protein
MKDVKRSGGKEPMATTDLLGAKHIKISDGHRVVTELRELAVEFPGYEFATQQTWEGISIIARRHGGDARPGLYAVITGDLEEMRRTLLEDEAAQPPGLAGIGPERRRG